MRLKYTGMTFADGLTNGKIYEGREMNPFCFLVQDDSGSQRIYSRENPRPVSGSSVGGRWDIVE